MLKAGIYCSASGLMKGNIYYIIGNDSDDDWYHKSQVKTIYDILIDLPQQVIETGLTADGLMIISADNRNQSHQWEDTKQWHSEGKFDQIILETE